MTLQSLSLTNFRNYPKASFDFNPQTTLVVGPNTSGKTNLLEAIYFLATGRSFRATHDREAVASGKPFADVKCQMSNVKGDERELELQILVNEGGENTSSKRFKVNGIKKRLSDFAGNLRAVYFGPEEIQLVTGSPSRRRKFLDSVLVQVDREYARTLLEYEKVLRQRNRLLLLIREGDASAAELDYWDDRILSLGAFLSHRREEMIDYFNKQLGEHLWLLLIQPRPWSKESTFREREIAAGMTLWGPHREDFRFQKDSERLGVSERQNVREPDKPDFPEIRNSGPLAHRSTGVPSHSEFSDLSSFGSRGEQRLAVLHLKMAELEFISERVGERPVLLLDDIFSELDEDNRGRVLSLLGKQQTVITTTDRQDFRNGSEVSVLNLAL